MNTVGKNLDTVQAIMDRAPESMELLQTMVRSIRRVVGIAINTKGTINLLDPDETINAIASRRNLNIDSIRVALRTQFYLAVGRHEISPTDTVLCAQKVANSNDLYAIYEAYDLAEYKSLEWKILYDALIRLRAYNKALENLPTGSKEEIFVAGKIAETGNAELIYKAFELIERDSQAELLLASALAKTKNYARILEAFELVHFGSKSSRVLTDAIALSNDPKIIWGALKYCDKSGTYESLTLARALKKTGDKAWIDVALKKTEKKSREYAILTGEQS